MFNKILVGILSLNISVRILLIDILLINILARNLLINILLIKYCSEEFVNKYFGRNPVNNYFFINIPLI